MDLESGLIIDKITVITQFISSDNTSGTLSAVRRLYVQNSQVIQNSMSNIAGVDPTNEITDAFCNQQKTAFGDTNTFEEKGGMAGMGEAFAKGMVLVLSIWDDHAAQMLWLDSNYPTNKDTSSPGVARGTCATTLGVPAMIESQNANAQVIFSNIKFGDIRSTFSSTGTSTGTGSTGTGTGTSTGTGPTACTSGSTCQSSGPYYSQCL